MTIRTKIRLINCAALAIAAILIIIVGSYLTSAAFVGAPIRQAAQETYAHKLDGSYAAMSSELRELRAFKEGVEIGVRARSEVPPAEATGEVPPPAAAPVSDFATRYPTLAAKCSKCHTGDEPKGGVWIDGTDPFDAEDQAAIATQIINERMPKGKPLEAQDQFNALVELFLEDE
jgi:mono/diheme cytochrome c family protein